MFHSFGSASPCKNEYTTRAVKNINSAKCCTIKRNRRFPSSPIETTERELSYSKGGSATSRLDLSFHRFFRGIGAGSSDCCIDRLPFHSRSDAASIWSNKRVTIDSGSARERTKWHFDVMVFAVENNSAGLQRLTSDIVFFSSCWMENDASLFTRYENRAN